MPLPRRAPVRLTCPLQDQLTLTPLKVNDAEAMVSMLADDVDELFVLPNEFDDRLQVGSHFDLSQLVRAVTTPQEAFALTLSQQGWTCGTRPRPTALRRCR